MRQSRLTASTSSAVVIDQNPASSGNSVIRFVQCTGHSPRSRANSSCGGPSSHSGPSVTSTSSRSRESTSMLCTPLSADMAIGTSVLAEGGLESYWPAGQYGSCIWGSSARAGSGADVVGAGLRARALARAPPRCWAWRPSPCPHRMQLRRGRSPSLRTGFKKIGVPGCVPDTRRWIVPDRLARATSTGCAGPRRPAWSRNAPDTPPILKQVPTPPRLPAPPAGSPSSRTPDGPR